MSIFLVTLQVFDWRLLAWQHTIVINQIIMNKKFPITDKKNKLLQLFSYKFNRFLQALDSFLT